MPAERAGRNSAMPSDESPLSPASAGGAGSSGSGAPPETDFATWGAQANISANEVLAKEALVREVVAMQDGLRALLARVAAVREECTKAEADNEMLQTYIDSVTKSLAAKS